MAEAGRRAGADVNALLASLRGAYSLLYNHRSFPEEWVATTPDEIATVIKDVYHAQIRRLLPALGHRLSFLVLKCGTESPELYDVGRLFEQLNRELSEHCMNEDKGLLPLLSRESVAPGRLEQVAAELEHDHLRIAALVAQIRALTLDYPLRRFDCPAMKALYDEWRDIEELTMRSIFLEENKLIPLARENY